MDSISANLETTTRNMSEFSRRIRDNPGVLLRGQGGSDDD
jgi:phospholipid/cholesterol/gamma-HCH transport system substrate-binding protein